MEILVALLVLLAIVTVVGHGIWVLLATLFGSGQASRPRPIRTDCPRCEAKLHGDDCLVCHWPLATINKRAEPMVRRQLLAQMDRYRQLGLLDAATLGRLQAALASESVAGTVVDPAAVITSPDTIATNPSAPDPATDDDDYQLAPNQDIPLLAEVVEVDDRPVDVTLLIAQRARQYAESQNQEKLAEQQVAAERLPVDGFARERQAQERREAEPPREPEWLREPPPRQPKAPSRPWTDLLSAFMEEKNIRWGELVGGLLIVCCSVALVISFWAKIAERPFLKFFVFNGVTAALFALGLYSERRWKLRTTSAGLLITAMLLVPLNFLAIAAFSQGADSRTLLTIAGELVSISLFSVLLVASGRTVVPHAVWPLAVGVMVPAVLQLLVRRFVNAQPSLVAEGFGLGILAVFAAVNLTPLWIGRKSPVVAELADDATVETSDTKPTSDRDALGYGTFTLLGITLFATALACGLVIFKTEDIGDALHRFAPLACLAGLTPLAIGLNLWRRLNTVAFAPQRTAALAIAVGGVLLLGAGVVLAWPTPALLLPSAAAAAVLLVAASVIYRLPQGWIAAAPCLVLFYLVTCHVLRGTLALDGNDAVESAHVLLSGTSGVLLAPMALIFGAAAAALGRLRRMDDGRYLALAALGVVAASVGLVSWFGFARAGDPLGATWIYLLYAVLAFFAAFKVGRVWVLHVGGALLMLALLQGVVFWLPQYHEVSLPWTTALLAAAGLTALLSTIVPRIAAAPRVKPLVTGLRLQAEIASFVAAGLLCAAIVLTEATLATFAVRSLAVAAVWLLLAIGGRSAAWFSAFQAALAVAACFAVAGHLESQAWFANLRYPWLDPWTITAQALALAGMAVGWIAVRWLVKASPELKSVAADASASRFVVATVAENSPEAVSTRSASTEPVAKIETVVTLPSKSTKTSIAALLRTLLDSSWPHIDTLLLRLVLGAAMALAVYAVLPGVAQELSPRTFVLLPTDDPLTVPRVVPPLSQLELPGIDHDHARAPAVWLLLALVAVGLLAETAVRKASWNFLGLLLVAALVCPLLASHWQTQVATASALRWLCAGFLLVASLPIWYRRPLANLATRWGWPATQQWRNPNGSIAAEVTGVFVLSLLPILAMAVYVGGCAVWRTPPTPQMGGLFRPLAIVFIVAACVAGVLRAIAASWHSAPRGKASPRLASLATHGSSLLVMLGIAPLLAITLYVVAAALKLSPILGPEPTSWFFRVGLAVSYAAPVLVTALTLVGYAIRERSQRFALSGSLVCNVGVTAAYLLSITKAGLQFDSTQWLRLAQLNAIVSATFALAWLGSVWWWSRRGGPEESRRVPIGELLVTLVSLPLALNYLVLVPTWLAIFVDPNLSTQLAPIADAWGWLAALAAGAALVCIERLANWPIATGRQLAKVLVVVVLLACDIGWWSGAPWAVLHALLILHIAICVLVMVSGLLLWRVGNSPQVQGAHWKWIQWIGLAPRETIAGVLDSARDQLLLDVQWRRQLARWGVLTSGVVVALAIRLLSGDPQSPWWSVGALLAVAMFIAWLACWALRRGLLYYAAVLINLAVTAWWNDVVWPSVVRQGAGSRLLDCIQVNVIALALPAVVWLLLELRVFRAAPAELTSSRIIPLQRLAARLAIGITTVLVGLSLLGDAMHHHGAASLAGQWLCVIAASMAATACLWDARARDAVALLYVALLLWFGALLDSLDLDAHRLLWLFTITLAAHALATSYLWSRRHGLRLLGDRLHVPRGDDNLLAHHGWLLVANAQLATLVVVLVFAIELTFADFTERVLAAKAVLIVAVSIGLLARGTRRSQLQYAALGFGALGVIALGWSAIEPGSSGALLNRAVVVTAALAATAVVYGLGLTKLLSSGNEWLLAAQRMMPVLIIAAACALVFVLGSEAVLAATQDPVQMSLPAILVVAATLLGLCGAALAAAVLPGRDPFGLTENGRKLYVYAAEIALVLLFVHIRLTMPWLFQGFFQRYWPLVVMLIAFMGAGVGEWLRRRKLTVLGDPLENTGALLPLLSVLGFWVLPSNIDYSLLLLSVGLLYTGLSVARKSFGFGVLAALAANGGLWYFLNRADGYRLLDHPQLWLIPPALCVLIAAQINRRQLTAAQMSGVRYGCSVAVYVSSTADIFLNGVSEAPWLPLVLAGLSLVGIFAGIWLRIRAFLFLGTAFLVLALMTVIWHAAVNLEQTWLWAASGIVAGVIIIAVFAVFEKKRDTVLGVVDQLKQWD